MFNIKEIVTCTMVLFAVIDIIGSIPIVIGLRQKVGHIQSEKASLVAGLIMIGFLFLGEQILSLIGIDVNSFAVAGALIIFFLALEMILGIQLYKDESSETASIVPIAFPIIAGSGTLTTIMSLKANFEEYYIALGILVNLVIVFAVLKSLNFIERMLGPGGLLAVRKFFGVILLAIAVKIFSSNVGALKK